jgi:hypothetical protein
MAEQQALQVVRVSSEGLGGEAVETVTGLARAAVEDITEGVEVALQVEAGVAAVEVLIYQLHGLQ